MVRTLVCGLLALVPEVSRADVGVALRRVPVHVTLTVDCDYPEFAFFLVDSERGAVQRVSPTATDPATVRLESAKDSYVLYQVYVVPKAELVRSGQAPPTAQWFSESERLKYHAGTIYARQLLEAFDNRDRIEKTYRVQKSDDGFRVDMLSENQGNPWVKGAWIGACCVLPGTVLSAAVVLAGIGFVRRSNRRRTSRRGPAKQ